MADQIDAADILLRALSLEEKVILRYIRGSTSILT